LNVVVFPSLARDSDHQHAWVPGNLFTLCGIAVDVPPQGQLQGFPPEAGQVCGYCLRIATSEPRVKQLDGTDRYWAGTDRVVSPERWSRQLGFRRRKHPGDPAPMSVHAVSNATGQTACGRVPAARLTRLDGAWSDCPAQDKCRDCARLAPASSAP
jgi:hypothetical protein